MTIFEQIARAFGKIFRPRVKAFPEQAQPVRSTGPRVVVNDALAYGVSIVNAAPAPGAWYWQAVRVHHLTPEENNGNHHIFLDLLDPTLGDGQNPDGERLFGARVRLAWDGGEQTITIDRPLSEPGANFPIWRWQVCSAQALGLQGQELPSDRVTGMHTGHPDEAPGNMLFHHSFSVTFVKVQAPAEQYADSVIYGVIRGAGGRIVLLLREDAAVASQPLSAEGGFRFTDLPAGAYVLAIEGTAFRSDPVPVDGRAQAQLDLQLALAESVISGRVRNGAGRTLRLLREEAEIAATTVAADETYRFAGLAAGAYRILFADVEAGSTRLDLDGIAAVTADFVAPALGKPLLHYVLFAPAEDQAALANLLLAGDYLLAFTPSFGFSPDEAAGAGLVTIIAGPDAVPAEIEAQLAADGIPVQRIAGAVGEVAAALAARIAAHQAFLPE